jgi:hypothetical protein
MRQDEPLRPRKCSDCGLDLSAALAIRADLRGKRRGSLRLAQALRVRAMVKQDEPTNPSNGRGDGPIAIVPHRLISVGARFRDPRWHTAGNTAIRREPFATGPSLRQEFNSSQDNYRDSVKSQFCPLLSQLRYHREIRCSVTIDRGLAGQYGVGSLDAPPTSRVFRRIALGHPACGTSPLSFAATTALPAWWGNSFAAGSMLSSRRAVGSLVRPAVVEAFYPLRRSQASSRTGTAAKYRVFRTCHSPRRRGTDLPSTKVGTARFRASSSG